MCVNLNYPDKNIYFSLSRKNYCYNNYDKEEGKEFSYKIEKTPSLIFPKENHSCYSINKANPLLPKEKSSTTSPRLIQETYQELQRKNYSPTLIAKIGKFLHANRLAPEEIAILIEIETKNESISDFRQKYYGLDLFCDFYKRNNIDLKKFKEYLDKINFDNNAIKLLALAYTTEEILMLFAWHYIKNPEQFEISSLAFKENLTNYLEENYTDELDLNALLLAHPNIERNIGEIPSDWLDRVDDKEMATKLIYAAIEDFQYTYDTDILSNQLSAILDKKVTVDSKPMSGDFGNVYRIFIEGANTVCLKIFKKYGEETTKHGKQIEPQTGIFLNKHSKEFVKMYFGKVAGKKNDDAFLVTQYLEPGITVNEGSDSHEYHIYYADERPENKICGKYIDFGGVYITKMKSFETNCKIAENFFKTLCAQNV